MLSISQDAINLTNPSTEKNNCTHEISKISRIKGKLIILRAPVVLQGNAKLKLIFTFFSRYLFLLLIYFPQNFRCLLSWFELVHIIDIASFKKHFSWVGCTWRGGYLLMPQGWQTSIFRLAVRWWRRRHQSRGTRTPPPFITQNSCIRVTLNYSQIFCSMRSVDVAYKFLTFYILL